MNKKNKNQAIALEYDPEKDSAPRVVAKGQGGIAQKIIDLAKIHNIPIESNINLAEILSKVNLDQFIPIEAYIVVAEIITTLNKNTTQEK